MGSLRGFKGVFILVLTDIKNSYIASRIGLAPVWKVQQPGPSEPVSGGAIVVSPEFLSKVEAKPILSKYLP